MVQLLNLLFPKFCVGCGRIGKYFCPACKKKIRYIEPCETICPVCEKGAIDGMTHPTCRTRHSLDGLVSVFHYDHTIKKAIKEIKYRFVSDLVSELVGMIDRDSFTGFGRFCALPGDKALTPIPLNLARQRFRGFNQSLLIGKRLGQRMHMPVVPDMLLRIRKTTPQVEMKDRKERLRNMKNVFAFNPKYSNNVPNTVVLVDDVFTTGATVSSACTVLKRAGVQSVVAFTIAR